MSFNYNTGLMDESPFDLTDRVAIITGGYGVLGGGMADTLARAGARVAILGRRRDEAIAKAAELTEYGATAIAAIADVLDEDSLHAARDRILSEWGTIDILVNAAGGNVARTDGVPPFNMPLDTFHEALRLNLHGTVIPSLVFGKVMARQKKGTIVNISSMAATQAISGIMGYSIAKAGVENFTKWLAVDLARQCGDGIRVNAIAPGFFLSAQNRAVFIEDDGSYSPRAERIVARTPMGRFGRADELGGALQFLCSDAASFVTGVVIPVDGGFSAYTGV